MPRRDSIPVERSSVRASVRGPAPRPLALDVHQLVLEQPLVGHGQAPGGHEAPRREGGQPELVGPPLGVEAPVHHGEGALGLGPVGRLGQRRCTRRRWSEAGLTKRGGHPHDALVGPHLDVGGHRRRVTSPVRARVHAVDVVGPGVARPITATTARTGPRLGHRRPTPRRGCRRCGRRRAGE